MYTNETLMHVMVSMNITKCDFSLHLPAVLHSEQTEKFNLYNIISFNGTNRYPSYILPVL